MTLDRAVGYISSSPFWYGAYLPQRIQSILVKDYCVTNNLLLTWTIPEVSKGEPLFMFNDLCLSSSYKNIDHIVAISLRMHSAHHMSCLIEESLKRKFKLHFVFENISCSSKEKANELNSLLRCTRSLHKSLPLPCLNRVSVL